MRRSTARGRAGARGRQEGRFGRRSFSDHVLSNVRLDMHQPVLFGVQQSSENDVLIYKRYLVVGHEPQDAVMDSAEALRCCESPTLIDFVGLRSERILGMQER